MRKTTMRRLFAPLLVALALLGGIVATQAAPASASTCAITNPYDGGSTNGVQTYNASGAGGCALVIITHINGDPTRFWFSWYIQETVDPTNPDSAGCAKMQYRKEFVSWINTAYPAGYDCNSADYTMSSGYMLINASYGGSGYDPKFQTRMQLANGLVTTLTEWHVIQ